MMNPLTLSLPGIARASTLLALGILLLAGCSRDEGAAGEALIADVIYHSGDIITVDDANPLAEAVAVADGLIVAVGSAAEVMGLQGPETTVVDLAGRTMTPGFIDGHAHLGGFGAQAMSANLLAQPDGDVDTIDKLIAALQDQIDSPDVARMGGWIVGMGYDDAVLAERRHPTRADLDKVSTEKPVMAVHISGHFSAMNSVGLAMIGYTAETPDPPGGIIRRWPGTTEPNGVLEELASIPFIIGVLSPADEDAQTYLLERSQQLAVSFGYTTAQEGRAYKPNHQAFLDFAEKGLLDIDVVAYIDYADRDLIDSYGSSVDYSNRYRIGGMKLTLDGSPQGRTAWRTMPYLLPPDGQPEGYQGYPAIPADEDVAALYDEAFAKGWQVLAHANGDAAADQLIRTMRPALDKYGPADRRMVLVHGQLLRRDQLDALAELNVIPSLFPMHTFYWGDWYDEIIGPELAQQISPMRSALDRGLIATSHTDAPVALPNLMQVMSATVNRVSRSGKIMGPDERLTPMEALKAITLWSAYQHFEEDRKGSIETGKLADLVILSANPLTIDPMQLGSIQVLETIKEGQTVYRAD
jgi:predicted amidohydrolase YtcJ